MSEGNSRSKFKKTEKLIDEDNNPCVKEQNMSYECLSKTNYNYDKCSLYFENYKACKAFWNKIRLERLAKGIFPNMPSAEERAEIQKSDLQKKVIDIS